MGLSWNARKLNSTTCEITHLGTSNLFCKLNLITWKQHRRKEQSSEVQKASSKDADVYMSTRIAQHVHGNKLRNSTRLRRPLS